jgi:hypothetical protein
MVTDLRYALGQLRRAQRACQGVDGGLPARDALANLLTELRDVHQRALDGLERALEAAQRMEADMDAMLESMDGDEDAVSDDDLHRIFDAWSVEEVLAREG